MRHLIAAPLFWPVVALVATTLVALGLRWFALGAGRRWGAVTLVDTLRVPSIFWSVVAGIYVAAEVAQVPPRAGQRIETLLVAAIILSVTVTLSHAVATVIARRGERLGGPVTGLAQTSARLIVLLVGLLIMLGALGVQITPILTALGVGGLAVALALQDTLSNLFAGMHLLADRPIRVGDYVKIADSEGHVIDVGWRSTRVRTLQGNVVIVPNHKVAQSVIVNYDLPDSRLALSVRVDVNYRSDPEEVERVLADEAARSVGEVPGLLGEPPPFVRFIPGFGDSSLDFTVTVQVATFVDQFLVQHELRKRLLRRLRAEGIELPVPVRVVEMRSGGSGAALADEREES